MLAVFACCCFSFVSAVSISYDGEASNFFAATVDNVIRHPNDFNALKGEVSAVGNQFRTYWIDPKAQRYAQQTHIEAVASALTTLARVHGCLPHDAPIAGIEWWVKSRDEVRFHIDKDEGAGGGTNGAAELHMPECSAVMMLSNVGGPLAVLGARPRSTEFDGFVFNSNYDAMIVPMRANRVTMFGKGFVHGVLRDERRASDDDKRLTLIASWWSTHRPRAPHCVPAPWTTVFADVIKLLEPDEGRAVMVRVLSNVFKATLVADRPLNVLGLLEDDRSVLDAFPVEQLVKGQKRDKLVLTVPKHVDHVTLVSNALVSNANLHDEL